ncbi:hypothetical protein Tco_0118067 [Tanacetum coccineum]
MSENKDRCHNTVLDLEAKLKKNVDLILKLGNSLQGMFMLGPKPLFVYDQQLKHGLGYPNPYTLKQAIFQCPKLYLASSLGNLEISLNIRDIEDTLDDASKNFVPQKELSAEQKYFPSSFIPSDKNSNATPSIPASMPSESPLIIELDKIKNCFQRLSELIQKNCKRASIFYTSPEEIQLNDFCQDQLKPIVNELQFYFEFFKTLFQRDIKEMKDVFESTESELCELEKQNDFLKDQLLEVSLKHEVELSVLLNHECVDNSLHAEIEQLKKKSIEIQEDLEAKLKKNVDLILKLGNSLQGMFMLGPKPLSVYDQQLKHGLGYPNPYTLKQAISQCPKLYLASSLGNSEISLNVRDTEDTLDDASKSQQKVYEKMNDPIAVANKQNCWTIDYAQINALYKDFVPQKELSAEQKYFPSSFIPSDKNSNATPSIPASMPSESPLIIELDKIKNGFQKLSELIQKNCKRASIFYTSPEEIQLNDFCQDQLKPIVNELQFYFEFFKTLFQRDIKEMKDVFESTESELCELEKQNDFLKDQLLEVSLKHEVELSVLLNHECVDNSLHAKIEQLKKKSIKIQEGLQTRIKILEKDVQRFEKQSVDFEIKLQYEKDGAIFDKRT